MPVYPLESESPVCDCPWTNPMGFTTDAETGMQVHYRAGPGNTNLCGRPTKEYLDSFYRSIMDQEGEDHGDLERPR